MRPLLKKIFDKGKCVYTSPATDEIKDFCESELNTLWDEIKRFENPHKYYVDLSEKLWNINNDLLNEISYE